MELKTCTKCLAPLPPSAFYSTGHWCIQCQKDKVVQLRERKKDAGLTIKGNVPLWRLKAQAKIAEEEGEEIHEACTADPVITKSERAIQREIEKREEEDRIALRFRTTEEVKNESAWEPVSLGRFLRQPTKVSGWGCPVGSCSVG